MSIEIAFLVSLVILLIGTQFFWMRHTQVLVNKLMSRDYSEYAQNEKLLKKEKVKTDKQPMMQGFDEMGVMGDFRG